MKKLFIILSIFVPFITLIGCGGGGGGGAVNQITNQSSNVIDELATEYPALANAYLSIQTPLIDNDQTVDERIASFSTYIADDFLDTSGNPNKKQELLDLTKSRLERYTINSYSFTPVNYETVSSTTVNVFTDMVIDVKRKPGAIGAVSAATIPLYNKKVTWKKYGTTWKIYQGLPYKSDEIGI